MKLKAILLTLACLGFATSASATVVTFDDLVGSGVVANGYGGINWDGVWNYYDFSQPPYTAHSPLERVYDFAPEGRFTFVTPNQVFDGAWFSGFDTATVTFNLYNDSLLVWTSATLLPSSVPAFLASGYAGVVDAVGVVSPRPDFFVMDDVTYNSTPPTVPEPASMVLFASGLGLAWVRRRRSASAPRA